MTEIKMWKKDAFLPDPGDPAWDQKSWPVDFIEALRAMCHEIDTLADYLDHEPVVCDLDDSLRDGYDEHIGEHIGKWSAVLDGFSTYRRIQLGLDAVRVVETGQGPVTIIGNPDTIDIAGNMIKGLAVDPAQVAKLMMDHMQEQIAEADDDNPAPGLYI